MIDIYVNDKNNNNKYIFYEIKALTSAKACIREAIGQLLEYSMWLENKIAHELIVLTIPLGDSQEAIKYIKHIRKNCNIPVFYRTFDLETKILSDKY